MTDKLDFKGALSGYERAKNNGDLTTWFACNENLFLKALRLADRLQSGEVSEIMICAGVLAALNEEDDVEEEYVSAFKAMSAKMMKEVCDE